MLNGCYFQLKNELIEDTIDDIIEIINAKYENRAYLSYLVSSLFATEQKTYKEQRHLISQAMIVRLEHPVFVPDEAIDYARNVANHIGKHKFQAKQFVAHKNHSERDERVAHAHQSIFH